MASSWWGHCSSVASAAPLAHGLHSPHSTDKLFMDCLNSKQLFIGGLQTQGFRGLWIGTVGICYFNMMAKGHLIAFST